MSDSEILVSGWTLAWKQLGLTPAPGELQQLLGAHRAPQRHYHGLQHIAECLQWLHQLRAHVAYPAELALALCFHDAVYDTRAKDSEAQSAQWAQRVLQAAGAHSVSIWRVNALIMATCHFHAPPAQPAEDTAWMLDIDLAILGAQPERFTQYQAQIRAEYAWVPEVDYAQRRQQVLRSFLQRSPLYLTRPMQQLLERQARQNLQRALGMH